MPKFYVRWRLDTTHVPTKAEERAKAWLSMLKMVKADMKAGLVKDWGCDVGGYRGYSIHEAPSATELNTGLLKWIPYVNFKVMSVLTVDQTMESIKAAAAASK